MNIINAYLIAINIVIRRNHVINNGGAIYAIDSNVYVSKSRITDNIADNRGGAFYFD